MTNIPQTNRSIKVLTQALEYCKEFRHEFITPEHVLMQLKVLQEVITLTVFTVIATFFLGGERLQWNHIAAFICLIAAVYFVFMLGSK